MWNSQKIFPPSLLDPCQVPSPAGTESKPARGMYTCWAMDNNYCDVSYLLVLNTTQTKYLPVILFVFWTNIYIKKMAI